MRDESRVVLNALLSYGSRAVSGVVGILMVPYLIGRLGEQRYGTIGVAASITSLAVLIELGVRPAASRQFTRFLVSGETRRANELASTASAFYAFLALVIVAIAFTLAGPFLGTMQIPASLQPEASVVLVLLTTGLGVRLLQAPYEAALASQLRYDVTQYMEAAGALMRAGFIVGIFSLWRPSLVVWAVAAVLVALVSLVVHRWQAYRHCADLEIRPALVSRRGAQDLGGFAAYTSLFRFANWLTIQSGPLVISYFLGPEPLARYLPAMVLVVSLQPLSRAFLQQLTPVVTRAHATGERGRIQRVLTRSTRYTLLVSGGAVVLVASLAFALVPVWLGEGFEVTAWVLLVACAQPLLHSAVGGSFAIFVGTGRIGLVTALNVFLAVICIAASAAMVGWTELGILGPVLAILGVQIFRTLGWFFLVTSVCRVERLRYLRESFAGPLLCLAALAATAAGIQRVVHVHPVVDLLVAAAGAGLVFAAATWAVGLSADDRLRATGYLEQGWRRLRAVLTG